MAFRAGIVYTKSTFPVWLAVVISLFSFICIMKHAVRPYLDSHHFWGLTREMVTGAVVLDSWELDTARGYKTSPPVAGQGYNPTVRQYDLVIAEGRTVIAGVERIQLLINGRYPGPLLEAVVGDTIVVRIRNKSSAPTTIHFHGQLMNGTNYLDGVPGTTQCPVMPGREFTYRFTADAAGTFWYHSHFQLQHLQGVVGPMVVHESEPKPIQKRRADLTESLEYEEDTVILLTDAYGDDMEGLLNDYYEPYLGGREPVPSVSLMQGKQRALFSVRRGKKHRFRLINASSYLAYQFSIDNHLLRVIEADATATEPYMTPYIPISAGQRYSFVIEPVPAGEEPAESNFWVRANVQKDALDDVWRDASDLGALDARGILTYEGTRAEPLSMPWSGGWRENNQYVHERFDVLHLEPRDAQTPPPAEVERIVDAGMADDEGVKRGAFNGTYFEPRSRGSALAQYVASPATRFHHQHAPGQIAVHAGAGAGGAFNFDKATTVDLVVRNFDDGPHPFHLHGHRFWVMAKGTNSRFPTASYTARNPLQRDTVTVARDSWARLRFIADNPGVWLFHCHNAWHAHSGMALEIVNQPARLSLERPTDEWYEQCIS